MRSVSEIVEEHQQVIGMLDACSGVIELVANIMGQALTRGNRIFWMGNGGSAADSQHLAADLIGRFISDGHGLPAIALTADTSVITAIANDYSFDALFSQQINTLCQPGDIVVGISTSGRSENIVRGAKCAKRIGAYVVALTGADGGTLTAHADCSVVIPSHVVARVQEAHILIGHIWCEYLESIRRGEYVHAH